MDSRRREHLLQQLSAYLDGELAGSDRREVESLLADDLEARNLLADLRGVSEALHALPRAKASDHLMEGVRSRLERNALLGEADSPAHSPPHRGNRVLRWGAIAAVLGLSATTLYLVGPLGSQEKPPIRLASAEPRAKGTGEHAPHLVPENEGKVLEKEKTLLKGHSESLALKDSTDRPAQKSPALPRTAGDETKTALQERNHPFPLFGDAPDHDTPSAAARAPSASMAMKQLTIEPAQAVATKRDVSAENTRNWGMVASSQVAAKLASPSGAADRMQTENGRRIALVELTSATPVAQQQTADQLRKSFAFRLAGSSHETVEYYALMNGPGKQEELSSSQPVVRGGISGIPQERQDTLGENKVSESKRLVLRRAMPDHAMPATLEQVQSQWPAARVRVIAQPSVGEEPGRFTSGSALLETLDYKKAEKPAGPKSFQALGGSEGSANFVAGAPLSPTTQLAAGGREAFGSGSASSSRDESKAGTARKAAPARAFQEVPSDSRGTFFDANRAALPASGPASQPAPANNLGPDSAVSRPASVPSDDESEIIVYLDVTAPATRPADAAVFGPATEPSTSSATAPSSQP